jgi:hypothetical protein
MDDSQQRTEPGVACPPASPTGSRVTPEPDESVRQRLARAQARVERLAVYRCTHEGFWRHFGGAAPWGVLEAQALGYELPGWTRGAIGVLDACFLTDALACLKPTRVLELGAASGGSTLVMLRAMRLLGAPLAPWPGGASILSLDLHPRCFSDQSRPTGAAVDECDPALAPFRRVVAPAQSFDLSRLLPPGACDFAFIDADHRHPWPTIDALASLGALRPGSWIALHDIDLPAAAERYERKRGVKVSWHEHGAKWLFEAWPLAKFAGEGACANIGMVRTPRTTGELAEVCASLAATAAVREWEATPPPRAIEVLRWAGWRGPVAGGKPEAN